MTANLQGGITPCRFGCDRNSFGENMVYLTLFSKYLLQRTILWRFFAYSLVLTRYILWICWIIAYQTKTESFVGICPTKRLRG